MKNGFDSPSNVKKKSSPVLLSITTVFGILYVMLIISELISGPYNLEYIVVNMAFLVFLVGYYFTWKNEMIAGIIFIFWWGIMWYLGLFIAEHDKGVGVVMGVPLFIVGILFIVSWRRKKQRSSNFKEVKKIERPLS
jgi:hypothetical protein